ncbi:hypothetical protein BpHYR1_017433 [Brachionus plicatilis]|uniref:Uncharacterized protein n=1 Tax=Brachionus plicatilis TaxID=10195 RepID=A0A3M7P7L2_BRAPC|nr:hypothetical protein BpHYR1_017433 [Brachionus plicatilis]
MLNYVLVQFLIDDKFSIVEEAVVAVDRDQEIEINAIYDIKWAGEVLKAEVKLIGDYTVCDTQLKSLSEGIKKNIIPSKKVDKSVKKTKQIKANKSDNFKKNAPSTSKSTSSAPLNVPLTSKSTPNSPATAKESSVKANNNVSKSFHEQLEERNKIIDKLTIENDELKKENGRLNEQLKMTEILQDLRTNFNKKLSTKFKNYSGSNNIVTPFSRPPPPANGFGSASLVGLFGQTKIKGSDSLAHMADMTDKADMVDMTD